MPGVHREGDANTAGGAVDYTLCSPAPQTTVFADNKVIAVNGSQGTRDSSCNTGGGADNGHCACTDEPPLSASWSTTNGSSRVFAGGLPINVPANLDDCGHPRSATASTTVFIEASSGTGGVLLDNNPPYAQQVGGLTPVDSVPTGGQSAPVTPYLETITLADVHVYHNNNDDPDDTLGSSPPLTFVKPNISTLDTDLTAAPANTAPSHTCTVINALPASFNWKTHYGSPQPADFDAWANDPGTYPEVQLSTNFTVGDLTINTAVSYYEFTTVVNQANGMSQKTILQNLCYLANTLLEPLRTRYGATFTITSAYRNKSGTSQHVSGEAIDLQFLGFHGVSNTRDLYFTRAQDVRDNIEFDQLILEWFGRNPWLHISIDSTGLRNTVLTQTAHNAYTSGLLKIG